MRVKTWIAICVLTGGFVLSAMAFDYSAPETTPGEKGWELYVNPPKFDQETAKGISTGNGSPAAVVTSFYLSKLRGDEDYNDVLLPSEKRSRKLLRTLERTKDWKYVEFQLVGQKNIEGNRYWVKISIKVEIDGKIDGGTDEAQVRYINGRWIVYTVPS